MKKLVLMAAAAVLTFSLSSAVFADDNTAALNQQLQIAQGRVNEVKTLLAQLEAAAPNNPIAAAQVQNVKAGLPALEAEVTRIQSLLPAQTPAVAAADPAALMALLAQQQTAATPAASQTDAAAAQAAQLAQVQAIQLAQAQAAQAAQIAQAQAAQAQTQTAQTPAAPAAPATPVVTAPTIPAVPAATHSFTDKNGTTHNFTMDEWNYLISVWAYTGQGEEMVTHHTIGDLMAVLAARG